MLKEEHMQQYLQPTEVIDSDHPAIRQKAEELSDHLESHTEKAIALFYFVRDQIKYNPFMPRYLPAGCVGYSMPFQRI